MNAESVRRIVSATAGVRVFIAAQVTVVEGGNSPHLLPSGVDKLLTTSVQLAAHLGESLHLLLVRVPGLP